MATFFSKLEKHKNWVLLGLCFLIFFLYLKFGFVFYETNDDETMNLIAVGAFGYDSKYVIYLNILELVKRK